MTVQLRIRPVLLSCIALLAANGLSSAALGQTASGVTPASRLIPATPAIPATRAPQRGAPGTVIVPGTVVPPGAVPPGAVPSTAVTTAEAQQKAAEAQIKAQQLSKLRSITFDRRASTILKAWSEPEPESEAAKKDDAKKDDAKKDDAKNADAKKADTKKDDAKKDDAKKDDAKKGDAKKADAKKAAAPPKPVVAPETSVVIVAETMKKFDEDLRLLKRNVTLGRWERVGKFIGDLDEEAGKQLYARLLSQIRLTPNAPRTTTVNGITRTTSSRTQMPEKNVVSFDDVFALAKIAPVDLEDSHLTILGGCLRLAYEQGHVIDQLVVRLSAMAKMPEDERLLDKNQIAKLLFAAGNSIEAGDFLPTLDDVKDSKDFEALNLLTRHLLALHAKEEKRELLEQAWEVTQVVLGSTEIEKDDKEQALRRAVELAPKIRKELGEAWLAESFTNRPRRGMEIIASIGGTAAKALTTRATDSAFRLKGLQLQTTAVEALLKAAPEQAEEWRESLTLLAGNWLREADVSYTYDTSTSMGPQLQRDQFGNFFYGSRMVSRSPSSRISAIATGELLDIKPSDLWLAKITDDMKPKFAMSFAKLYLKVSEDESAFPHIEDLAKNHPDLANELVDEFLRVWTKNHDPNSSRNRTGSYMFMYGFERRKEAIPLTRSKQQRNLDDLAKLVARLRKLPLEELNEELLARAFTRCHSQAEVYQIESIERVFGSLGELDPETLAEMAQQMRANLIGVWRQPAVQKDNKTRRRQKDIEAEVLRGYEVARTVIDGGLENYPEDWALHLAKAALMHDENNYRKELSADNKFSDRRGKAFAAFEHAADLYSKQIASGEMEESDESTKPFEIWFYASLGASDLNHVTEETSADLRQPEKIREAILSLDDEKAAERHMSMFANTLFTRMSAAKPAVKFRYLRSGFDIVGDHKRAKEARKVFDYYKDLVNEIKLEAVIDGSDVVGHDQPFGVFVNLRHTREIERESGGFSRYLQNQNTSTTYSYNYGRPTEDYRDKFEEAARQALKEQFEILSVTFQSEDVNSKATDKYGWRVTSYAYLLLKPRGPEVDEIPPLQLDLDFLDTSGYAVLPIESAIVPLDATSSGGEKRPLSNLTITQTLDERQADEGKLIVEIKASGHGLIPSLNEILDFKPKDFAIKATEDQGVAVSRFDPESEETQVVSERTWMVTLNAAEGLDELPDEFTFAEPTLDLKEAIYQRYNDADLSMVAATVSLEQKYGEKSYLGWIIGGSVVCLLGLGLLIAFVLSPKREEVQTSHRYALPKQITPFTVIGLLRDIESTNGLNDLNRKELVASISRLEQQYFDDSADAEADLHEIASNWIRKAR